MLKWIHQLLNPHCPDCALEKSEKKVCQSCQTLIAQLMIANSEKKQLLDSILHKPEVTQALPTVDYEQLRAKTATWSIRKQMLEAEDRKTAALLQNKRSVQQRVNDLEKELGVEENVKPIRQRDEKDIQPGINEEVG